MTNNTYKLSKKNIAHLERGDSVVINQKTNPVVVCSPLTWELGIQSVFNRLPNMTIELAHDIWKKDIVKQVVAKLGVAPEIVYVDPYDLSVVPEQELINNPERS